MRSLSLSLALAASAAFLLGPAANGQLLGQDPGAHDVTADLEAGGAATDLAAGTSRLSRLDAAFSISVDGGPLFVFRNHEVGLRYDGALPGHLEAHAGVGGAGFGRVSLDLGGFDFGGMLGDLDLFAGQVGAAGTASASVRVDDVDISAEVGRATRGGLVAIPLRGATPDVRLLVGAEHVTEYAVFAVQGFDCEVQADVEGQAGVATAFGQEEESFEWSTRGDCGVRDLGLSVSEEEGFMVALVGVGVELDRGGFYVLADLEIARAAREDVLIQQLEMPPFLGNVSAGGHFDDGRTSAGVEVELLTFQRQLAGADVELWVSHDFGRVDFRVGLEGHAFGTVGEARAQVEVGLETLGGNRVALIPGYRVVGALWPRFHESGEESSLEAETWGHEGDAGPLGTDLDGVQSQGYDLRWAVDQEEGGSVHGYPSLGFAVQIADTGTDLGIELVADDDLAPVGGRAELCQGFGERVDLCAGGGYTEELGAEGHGTLGVSFKPDGAKDDARPSPPSAPRP